MKDDEMFLIYAIPIPTIILDITQEIPSPY